MGKERGQERVLKGYQKRNLAWFKDLESPRTSLQSLSRPFNHFLTNQLFFYPFSMILSKNGKKTAITISLKGIGKNDFLSCSFSISFFLPFLSAHMSNPVVWWLPLDCGLWCCVPIKPIAYPDADPRLTTAYEFSHF